MQTQMLLMSLRVRIDHVWWKRGYILRPYVLRIGRLFGDVESEVLECTSDEIWPYACGASAFNGKIERKVSWPTVTSV